MRVQILQHVPFEGPGSIEAWLAARQATIDYTRFFAADALPDPAGIDLIVALGGPMSVNDEALLPWLAAEKRFLAAAARAGKAILGICLGAQLIASALGARVYPGIHREIGWFEIEATPTDRETFRFPDRATVFHWHGETFGLPPGGVRLARSAACANQAFQFGRRVIGLQCHLETTAASLDALACSARDELLPGPFVQSESVLRAAPPERFAAINGLMAEVLAYVTAEAGTPLSRACHDR